VENVVVSSRPLAGVLLAALFLALGGCGSKQGPPVDESGAHFVRQIPWAGNGQWIRIDMHIHTTFSDGADTPAEVAQKALQYGCRAIAITDHADRGLKAATPEYEAAITAERTAHPDLLILAGLEWNVPPWAGDEHASVLMPGGPGEWKTLADFRQQFDDYQREGRDHAIVEAALKWLAENGTVSGVPPVVVYNHPSLKDSSSMDNVPDVERWRAVNDLVIGFEGGPGHQRMTPLGDYREKQELIDRWDPAVAKVGDAWDTLLQKGLDVGGAYTASDFHDANPKGLNDPWPCQFSETWLNVPDTSALGVLKALRAGIYYGVHGHIASNVSFTVETTGLPRAALPGEVIRVPSGATVTARVKMDVPATDWQNQPNKIDAIELIGVSKDKAAIIATRPLDANHEFAENVTVPAGGVVLRARARRVISAAPDLMVYTNPIRVQAK
jgi:hypothetical protein